MKESAYGFERIQLKHLAQDYDDIFLNQDKQFVFVLPKEHVAEIWAEAISEEALVVSEDHALFKLCEMFPDRYVLCLWKHWEEIQMLFYSPSNEVRSLEFLDYLIETYGLVKGDGTYGAGRITSAILQVQMSAQDLTNETEYFLKKIHSYFEECDMIYASSYGREHRDAVLRLPVYEKKQVMWAYVKSTDIVKAGRQMRLKSLENESGLVVTASEDIYIMIGCRGEIYDIRREKFEKTYVTSEEELDIFETMLDFLPAVESIPEGEYISIDEIAHLCYPRQLTGIYACELLKRTKVFPDNLNQGYFLGRPGDYMAIRIDDLSDVYIIQGDIFEQTYERKIV